MPGGDLKSSTIQELRKVSQPFRLANELMLVMINSSLARQLQSVTVPQQAIIAVDSTIDHRGGRTCLLEKLESSVFKLECERDKLKAEVAKLRGENTGIQQRMMHQTKEISDLKCGANDQEQHGRLWNFRVVGVQ
ncbi:hypothetical protein ACOMHN_053786 [Nucella lapillus]